MENTKLVKGAGRTIDITGQRFGTLTVQSYAGSSVNGKGSRAYWDVLCDCGEQKTVRGTFLRTGQVRTCGRSSQHKYMAFGVSDHYNTVHVRVRRTRGKASTMKCQEPSCISTARDWAHTHGTDKSDPENYRALCRMHHVQYDAKENYGRRKKTLKRLPKKRIIRKRKTLINR